MKFNDWKIDKHGDIFYKDIEIGFLRVGPPNVICIDNEFISNIEKEGSGYTNIVIEAKPKKSKICKECGQRVDK